VLKQHMTRHWSGALPAKTMSGPGGPRPARGISDSSSQELQAAAFLQDPGAEDPPGHIQRLRFSQMKIVPTISTAMTQKNAYPYFQPSSGMLPRSVWKFMP